MTAKPAWRMAAIALAAFAGAGPPASFAATVGACGAAASAAALDDVARSPWAEGRLRLLGRPYEIEPGVLRVEVDAFGSQMLVFSVDVTVDWACRVLAASARLDSSPGNGS